MLTERERECVCVVSNTKLGDRKIEMTMECQYMLGYHGTIYAMYISSLHTSTNLGDTSKYDDSFRNNPLSFPGDFRVSSIFRQTHVYVSLCMRLISVLLIVEFGQEQLVPAVI